LGEPSRAFATHLALMVQNPDAQAFGDQGRILLSARFGHIQGAKPAHSPYAVNGAPMTEERKQARKDKLSQLRAKKQNKPAAEKDVEMESKPASGMNDSIRKRLYADDGAQEAAKNGEQ